MTGTCPVPLSLREKVGVRGSTQDVRWQGATAGLPSGVSRGTTGQAGSGTGAPRREGGLKPTLHLLHKVCWVGKRARAGGFEHIRADTARLGWVRGLFAAVVVATLAAVVPAAAESTASVWELTPYEVQVWVAMDRAPELTPALAADLQSDLSHRLDVTVGAVWNPSVVSAPAAIGRQMLAGDDAPAVETLPKTIEKLDKLMLLTITSSAGGYRVRARELDVRTRTWNTPVVRPVGQAAGLLECSLRAVREAFAPLALIASADRKTALLRLRAYALPSDSGALAAVSPGDVFQPVIRKNDHEGHLASLSTIPFTFFAVEKISDKQVQCAIHSGMRNPMSEKRRGRIEQLAIGIIPPHLPTTLTLQSRSNPRQMLAGYDVYVYSPHSTASELLGRSDRQGSLVVPPAKEPLRVLLVRSGDQALARLPIVPGRVPQITAPIPDDDQRLAAEGFLNGWQEELVDLVTRREVLLIQARARLKEERLDEAAKLLDQVRSLKTREAFSRELTDVQRKTASPDPGVQKKIDAMFAETQKALQQHLDPAAVDKLAEAIRAARTPGK